MSENRNISPRPHHGQPVRMAGAPLGAPLSRARAAMLMLHGRGARAEDILSLVDELAVPGFAYLAPQATDNTWYPNRFLAPLASNEPWLSSALAFVDDVFAQILAAGIPAERTVLLGFSQGACLALEYAARHARRYGGLVGLSGALIGPDGTPRDDAGSLAGTPVFLGCSDVDFHVPKERVEEAADVLRRLGGDVTVRLYPNLNHTVNQDEIDFVREMMQALLAPI
ncbi:MAG TPA: dienelactone hydrolase family protein [Anaerolineales bacterium]|nr:dienelactone hydrolase family protein [Anaerolineales bacterium]